MGAAVGAAVAAARDVRWASEDRSAASADRAAAAGLGDAGTVSALRANSDVLLSIRPPHAALDVAGQVTATAACSSTATRSPPPPPGTSRRSSRTAAPRTSTAASSGPPPANGRSARLYLSGARAAEVAVLFAGTPGRRARRRAGGHGGVRAQDGLRGMDEGLRRAAGRTRHGGAPWGLGTRSRPSGRSRCPTCPRAPSARRRTRPRRAGAGWARWRRSRAPSPTRGSPTGSTGRRRRCSRASGNTQGHEAVRHQPPRPPGLPVELRAGPRLRGPPGPRRAQRGDRPGLRGQDPDGHGHPGARRVGRVRDARGAAARRGAEPRVGQPLRDDDVREAPGALARRAAPARRRVPAGPHAVEEGERKVLAVASAWDAP